MRVLGITAEGDSGAAVVEDGRIVAAVNEERLSRLKLVMGFPRQAIREVLRLANAAIGELDADLVASPKDLFVDELRAFEGWFQHQPDSVGSWLKSHASSRLARLGKYVPLAQSAYYARLPRPKVLWELGNSTHYFSTLNLGDVFAGDTGVGRAVRERFVDLRSELSHHGQLAAKTSR